MTSYQITDIHADRAYVDLRRDYDETLRAAGTLHRQAEQRQAVAAAGACVYPDQHRERAHRDRDEADAMYARADALEIAMHVAAIREGCDDAAILAHGRGRSGRPEWEAATQARAQVLGLAEDARLALVAQTRAAGEQATARARHRSLALSGRLGRQAQRDALAGEER